MENCMELINNKNKRTFGKYGEELALKHLKEKGYIIKEINFRTGRLGEIDIIAENQEYICFIEVKTRTSLIFGTPAESVGYKKQENIRKLAWTYLKLNGIKNKPIRFDIVEVTGIKKEGMFIPDKINIIQNAF